MTPDIVSVRHVKGHTLEIAFDGGEKGLADLSAYAKKGGVFAPLAEIEFFKKAYVNPDLGTVCWPNGADIAPETLHRLVRHEVRH